MKNVSGAEGREQGEHAKAELFFPSDGNFNTVVPLSQTGDEDSPSPDAYASVEQDEQDEQEEETLVPARASRSPRTGHTSRAKEGAEQSWVFMAALIVLSVAAGVVAGAYMLRSLSPAETHRSAAPAGGVADAGKVNGTKTAAEPSVPQASAPQPQTHQDVPAPVPEVAAAPTEAAASAEADTKPERVSVSEQPPRATPQLAEPHARRAAEARPRAERPARASAEVREASPAPARAGAEPRRAERRAPATANTPARPPLISSPPPSARPRKVIQWP